MDEEHEKGLEQLLDTPDLAGALESDRFKHFLDHVPFAIAVSELHPSECITYTNIEFERLTGLSAAEMEGRSWDVLRSGGAASGDGQELSKAIVEGEDHLGSFTIRRGEISLPADAWANLILDDNERPMFRLVALAEIVERDPTEQKLLEQRILEKDTLLRELQHRVKNNLQMITALIRLEARNIPINATGEAFDRLAGRIDSLSLLYQSLSEQTPGESVDLGIYLNQIASSVMVAHAVEGIHLDLQIDTWPVSINVAMPTGLVVNELLTNALKHAFTGRAGGTITLHSLVEGGGCKVVIADDGNGFAKGTEWPKPGKLGALIVQSLRQNAQARLTVESAPGKGVRVTIFFARSDASSS